MTPSDLPLPSHGSPDSPPRRKMVALRIALLRLHKALLEMERRDYQHEHGYVSAGELFQLIVDHPQFAWLHSISEFVVRLDELLDGDPPVTPADVSSVFALARKMFTPLESGDSFQQKYFEAIQRDPAVVMELADVARLFADETSGAGSL